MTTQDTPAAPFTSALDMLAWAFGLAGATLPPDARKEDDAKASPAPQEAE